MPQVRDVTAAASHVGVFLFGSLVWMVVMGVGAAVVLLITDPSLLVGFDPEDLDGMTMGVTSALQIAGLAALAGLLASLLGHQADAEGHRGWWTVPSALPHRLKEHLALRGSPWTWLVVGGLGGLTVWTFPSYLAAFLIEALQLDSISLEATSRLLLEGPLTHRLAMGFAVVVTAPLFEELIFRGYLWEVAERAAGTTGAFVLTTLLFAAYHLDPVHSLSLLPTAAFLGALRAVSGSVVPAILAHFANNGVAVLVTLLTRDMAADETLPLWFSIVGTTLSLACFVAGWAWTRRYAQPPGAPS